jgi:hypothetical protein
VLYANRASLLLLLLLLLPQVPHQQHVEGNVQPNPRQLAAAEHGTTEARPTANVCNY